LSFECLKRYPSVRAEAIRRIAAKC